jgi:2'-5' RNA ligase
MACPRLRLFVGIYPPAEVGRALIDRLRDLDLAPQRTTPVAQVHLTAHFIGDVRASELDDAMESVERSCAGLGAFHLMPERLITLPERGHPRLVACETDAPPALLELRGRLVRRFVQSARVRPNDRFRPHLTLCRFRPDARAERIDEPVSMSAFAVERVMLVRSVLRPEGAVHEAIGTFSLRSGSACEGEGFRVHSPD